MSGPDDETVERTQRLSEPTPIQFDRGATLGRYVVIRPIATGGMGQVFEGYDPDLHRRVAIKLLFASTSFRHDLLVEARTMAKLSHPNIVAIHDVGTHEDRVFLAMELVDGPTVRSWLKERPRTLREILPIFLEAGRGLAAAHAASIVHRDFKAANVLIGNDGRVRVTDFGIAHAEGEATFAGAPLRASGRVIRGTPGYIAPEQFDGRSDHRSDQFAFCVALYDALLGERPFGGTTVEEYEKRLRAGMPTAPPDARRVPSWLWRILVRGLRADPNERYPTMDRLLEDLGRDRARQRRRIALVAGVAGLAALAMAGSVARRRSVVDRKSVV